MDKRRTDHEVDPFWILLAKSSGHDRHGHEAAECGLTGVASALVVGIRRC